MNKRGESFKVFIILAVLSLWGCNTSGYDWREYQEIILKGPFLQEKSIGKVQLSLRFIPESYLAFKELEKDGELITKVAFDSIKASYKNTAYFEFSVSPKEEGDLLIEGTSSYEVLKAKLYAVNFSFQEAFYIEGDDRTEIFPAGVVFDNTPHLGSSVKWIVLFDKAKLKKVSSTGGALKLVFRDPFWNTGKSYFSVNLEEFEKSPQLKI